MAEKFVNNVQDNFSSTEIKTAWQRKIKNFCNNTNMNGATY